ncbi:MAG: DegV family protein [Clostridiales bacterium]|nr:DegV family protein [Clostridiales bacterium]
MSVRIIVDSTADMTPQVQNQLTVVPLTILFGNEAYVDGVTLTHHQFYEKLVESDVMPTTSQASPAAFEDIFAQLSEQGEEAVVLTVSSKLSGTYQSAMIAAQDYDNVFVVDTQSVAIGAGILAQRALELVRDGLSGEAIARQLEKEREDICIVAMLDTLEYLKRGGRISKTVAFAGGLLSIKPVVSLKNGDIEILGKARGSRQGNNLLVREIQAAGGVNFDKPLLLGYTGMSDVLLKKYMQDSSFLWEGHVSDLPYTLIGSVVGTHTGPGAVAVAFFKNDAEC